LVSDLNLNYDLDFFLPSRTGYAALQYPIKLSGGAFSITLWIKFYEKDQTGNIMTIFTSGYVTLNSVILFLLRLK